MPLHKCPVPECPLLIREFLAMCPRHWFMVPGQFREVIKESWRSNNPDYMELIAAAVQAVKGEV